MNLHLLIKGDNLRDAVVCLKMFFPRECKKILHFVEENPRTSLVVIKAQKSDKPISVESFLLTVMTQEFSSDEQPKFIEQVDDRFYIFGVVSTVSKKEMG